MASNTILVTGTTGQVGGALLETLGGFTLGQGRKAEILAPTRAEFDLSNPASIRGYLRKTAPRWIVNPAAYTAVDQAESEKDLAYAVNTEAPRILGEEAASLGAAVVHFSTDYVFSGQGTAPWKETDSPEPQSTYGDTKLNGELALAASGAAHLILRTSWVYGATGKNFLLTILKAALERPELRIVADQHGAPTWSRDLAALTAQVLDQGELLAERQSLAEVLMPVSGAYHAADRGETTWFGFAQAAIQREQALNPSQTYARITPIATSDYPSPAKRPENSRLDCSKLARTFHWTMPHWQDSLAAVLAELQR